MNRREQKEYTKRILTDSAIKLFKQNGFQSTTVQQITDLAGVAKGTFFNYFQSKESVLHSIGISQIAFLESYYRENIDGKKSASENLRMLFHELAIKNENYGPNLILSTFQIWFSQLQFQEEESVQARRFSEIISAFIKKGQQQGEFKHTINPFSYTRVILNSYFGTLLYWVRNHSTNSLTALIEEMIDSYLSGIIKEK